MSNDEMLAIGFVLSPFVAIIILIFLGIYIKLFFKKYNRIEKTIEGQSLKDLHKLYAKLEKHNKSFIVQGSVMSDKLIELMSKTKNEIDKKKFNA